ncbi:UNVERIFIED_CONTAM: protein trichome birefringence-like 19 [Sesamum radiatum]|uniref:Protein trichome birefringence-like 19 n=1 Tax=Sesamum radiatum TaxID=300843 RepID=A0AAW2VMC8_SESRA
MKLQGSELPVGKPQPRRKTSKLAPLVALTIFLTIPLYYPTIRDSTKKLSETSRPYETLEEAIKPTTHLETSPDDNTDEPSTSTDASVETPPTDNTDEPSTSTDASLETSPTDNTDEPSTSTDASLETPATDNTDEPSTSTDAQLETPLADNTDEPSTSTDAQLETPPTDNTDEPSTSTGAHLETLPTDNTGEPSRLTDAHLETRPTDNIDEPSNARLETRPTDNTEEPSTLTDASLETGPTDNTDKPSTVAGARLETLPGKDTKKPSTVTGSHSKALPKENSNEPCSVDSSQCDDGNSGEDTAARHQEAPAKEKNEKEIKKRPHGPRIDIARQDGRRQLPISRSKDSSPQETRKKPGISRKDSSPQLNIWHPISRNNPREMIRPRLLDEEQCDMFTGEWVPNPNGPYYTNETCSAIQEHQNCIKFGRPDRGFLKWRWKPDDCELPLFDPNKFLELVRGKSIAFVGDSVARNHMQSLICLLSRVANPIDLAAPLDQNRRYEYRDYDFNVSIFWAPYLVRTEKTDPKDEKRPFKLYLDEFDEHWTKQIALFDYVIISAGHWFFRPTYFYVNNLLIGCLYCPESNVNHLTAYFSYRRAFRTAFRAINAANYSGVTFLRTYAPSHFEGAPWDKGGDCARKRPYQRKETVLEDYGLEMYLIQLEELRIAQKAGRRRGGKFRLFDATRSMLLRPDGHPSKYGHWPVANQTIPNDCVHWCLPGPIDAWNDFLQELLMRERR